MGSLVCRHGFTTVTAVQLAVGFVEITMQLAPLVWRQLAPLRLPRLLRPRSQVIRIAQRLPLVMAGGATLILHTE